MGAMPHTPLRPDPPRKDWAKKETGREKMLREMRERVQREDAAMRRQRVLDKKKAKEKRIKLVKVLVKKYFLWVVLALIFIWMIPSYEQSNYESDYLESFE